MTEKEKLQALENLTPDRLRDLRFEIELLCCEAFGVVQVWDAQNDEGRPISREQEMIKLLAPVAELRMRLDSTIIQSEEQELLAQMCPRLEQQMAEVFSLMACPN